MRDALREIDADSVDACVTDPPYHLTNMCRNDTGLTATPYNRRNTKLGFMGKAWDGGDIAFQPDTWRAVLRVLKPGGYMVCFASTRGYHRMVCAIEDAGFIIHPMLAWIFASGFPKATRLQCEGTEGLRYGLQALKPAIEPICMAQKPMIGTGTQNWQRYGTGALNIDACRVGTDGGTKGCDAGPSNGILGDGLNGSFGKPVPGLGRWPANCIHDGSTEVEAAFAAFGEGHARGNVTPAKRRAANGIWAENGFAFGAGRDEPINGGDAGSASRFFYSAKADASARAGSKHPTVKPTDLMRYLVRLVTPPGGTVLDPFAGSGSTGLAADQLGMNAVLIERDPEYAADIERKITEDCPLFASVT